MGGTKEAVDDGGTKSGGTKSGGTKEAVDDGGTKSGDATGSTTGGKSAGMSMSLLLSWSLLSFSGANDLVGVFFSMHAMHEGH